MEHWKCSICGYIHEGALPADFTCPICKQPAGVFKKQEEAPAPQPEKKPEANKNGGFEMKKFYRCARCGNLIEVINHSGVPVFCCGQKMEQLIPNTVEASSEKHLPHVTVEDGAVNVNVGSVNHPMAPEHYIEWVYVQTENGSQFKALKPGDEPNVTFALGNDRAVAVYAYCNLHGLWMVEV